MLAPSERAVVDVLFDAAGRAALEHRTPERTYPLAADHRRRRSGRPSLAAAFDALRDERRAGRRARADRALPRRASPTRPSPSSPRWTWASRKGDRSSTSARCTRRSSATRQGKCPKCGMKLLGRAAAPRRRTTPARCTRRSQRQSRQVPAVRHEAAADRSAAAARGARASRPRRARPRRTTPRAASSGRTTWSRSTG